MLLPEGCLEWFLVLIFPIDSIKQAFEFSLEVDDHSNSINHVNGVQMLPPNIGPFIDGSHNIFVPSYFASHCCLSLQFYKVLIWLGSF